MDIAVIGSGIAGLSCAWRLRGGSLGHAAPRPAGPAPRVTLYEANDYAGGHTHTVDIDVDGVRHPVDTGFLVFNRRTYPTLVALFDALGVETAASEMSFSVRATRPRGRPLEWAGTDLNSVFVQRRNAASPAFLRMLADIVRFNREAKALASEASPALATWTLGEYLDAHRYSIAFRDWYLLPMAAAIWSCSTAQMRDFPLATFVRFCANHGLLQVADRPQWYSVVGGARRYVERLVATLDDVRLASAAASVTRVVVDGRRKIAVRDAHGTTHYDHVVLACHSDQSMALLDDLRADEREVLGAIRYQPNRAVLHTDAAVLPARRGAWAAWNYERDARAPADGGGVCVHYLLNKLQRLPFARPVVVSLNPLAPPDPSTVLAEFDYAHPLFDARAIRAQTRLPDVQGRGNVWFCGAWTGFGFHEDGLKSGLAIADAIAAASHARASTEDRLAA